MILGTVFSLAKIQLMQFNKEIACALVSVLKDHRLQLVIPQDSSSRISFLVI